MKKTDIIKKDKNVNCWWDFLINYQLDDAKLFAYFKKEDIVDEIGTKNYDILHEHYVYGASLDELVKLFGVSRDMINYQRSIIIAKLKRCLYEEFFEKKQAS